MQAYTRIQKIPSDACYLAMAGGLCRRQLKYLQEGPDAFAARGCYCGWKTACFSFTSGCLPASFWTSFSYKFCCYRLWANKETTHIPGKGEKPISENQGSRDHLLLLLCLVPSMARNAASLSLSGKYLLSFLSIRSDIKKNRVKSNSKEKGHQRRTLPEPFSLEQIP